MRAFPCGKAGDNGNVAVALSLPGLAGRVKSRG